MSIYDEKEKPKGVRSYAQQFLILSLLILSIAAVLVASAFFPGGRAWLWNITQTLGYWANMGISFLGVGVLFLLPWFAGWLIHTRAVVPADAIVEPNDDLSLGGHFLIALAFGILVGGLGTHILFYGFWQHAGIQAALNTFGQQFPYETPPIGWDLYGAASFMISYAAAGVDWKNF